MHGLLYKIRGVSRWPECAATVSSVEVVSVGGRYGPIKRLFFSYAPVLTRIESGKLTVDALSPLFRLEVGDTFNVQYDPKDPLRIHSEEAQGLFMSIRTMVIVVGVIFAVAVLLINIFAERAK
jgi:hypothetical protein